MLKSVTEMFNLGRPSKQSKFFAVFLSHVAHSDALFTRAFVVFFSLMSFHIFGNIVLCSSFEQIVILSADPK